MAGDGFTIYHNPRCSKSRQTLALLEGAGHTPEIVEYLKTPPSADRLVALLEALDMAPRDLMRRGETGYKELGLDDRSMSDEVLIDAMVANPILIERPIVVSQTGVRLGRPPESVRELVE